MKFEKFFGNTALAMLLSFFFCFAVNAQVVKVFNLGTIANSVDESPQYLYLDKVAEDNGFAKIDSVVFGIYAVGEVDIDSLDVYPGFAGTPSGSVQEAKVFGTATTFTVTTNLAAGVAGYERLFSSGAGYALSSKRGYNILKLFTRGAASGNDPTDAGQTAWIVAMIYGSK